MKRELDSSGLNSNALFTGISDIPISDVTLLHETSQYKVYFTISEGRRVIIKTVNSKHKHADWLNHLLQREYQLLQQLDNPYIVRVWQLKEVPNIGLCIIMEYVDGMALDEYLQTCPYSKQRKQILNELMDALSYLHTKQMIHGDIKPQNILITRNGNHVKLIDMGLASKDEYVAHNVGFTYQYAAPEQDGRLSSPIDERTDIYSLGHIIRILFPCKYRFIYRKCLQKKPSKRYQSINDVRHAILSYPWRWVIFVILFGILVCGVAGIWIIQNEDVPFTPTQPVLIDTVSSKTEVDVQTDSIITHHRIKERVSISIENVDTLPIQSIHIAYRHLYESYRDSIANMPYQYQDFGKVYIHAFAQAINAMHLEYKSQYSSKADEVETDYISQYGIYYPLLTSSIAVLPDLWISYQEGTLSEVEYERLHLLIRR